MAKQQPSPFALVPTSPTNPFTGYRSHTGRSLSPLEERVMQQSNLHRTMEEAYQQQGELAQELFGSLVLHAQETMADSLDQLAVIRNGPRDEWARKKVEFSTEVFATALLQHLEGSVKTSSYRIAETAQRPFDLTPPKPERSFLQKLLGTGKE